MSWKTSLSSIRQFSKNGGLSARVKRSKPDHPRTHLQFLLQPSHVDDEAVFHVTLEQSLVGLVDLLSPDHFHVRGDIALGAEIEHLLGLAGTANAGASDLPPLRQQAKDFDRQRFFRRTDHSERAVALQQLEIGV